MVADHHGVERVFCPTRHRTSLDLPAIIDGLIAKPTTSVGVCFETPNYNVFRTTVDKDYFYVFFHVKTIASGAASYRMRLFVESAYSKAKAVPTRRKIPFGMLSEYVATSRKF